MDSRRRRFLITSTAAALAGLAGCNTTNDPTETETDDGGSDGASTASPTPGDAPPGADQLGGPDDLRSSAAVDALSLDADQGAGQFVFSPAVVWLDSGATVTWTIDSGSHSATAYHPDTGTSDRSTDPPTNVRSDEQA